MKVPPDADDPEHSGPHGVRPFLRSAAPMAHRPAGRADGAPPGEQTTVLRPFVITAGRVDGPDLTADVDPGAVG